MLVVAHDTTHAEALRQAIEADDFFGGRYKGRVIRVVPRPEARKAKKRPPVSWLSNMRTRLTW